MIMKTLIVISALIVCANAFGFGPNREHLNQNATLVCSRNDTHCIMDLYVTSMDRVDLIYFEDPSDPTIRTDGTVDSAGNGIPGTGTTDDPWIVSVAVSCDPLVHTTQSMAALADIVGTDVLEASVLVKSIYQAPLFGNLLFNDDVRYRPTCNFTNVGPDVIVAGPLFGTGDNDEDVAAEDDSSALEARTTINPMAAAFFANLGEDMFFIALLDNPETSAATGLFLYSCQLCDTMDCSAVAYEVVDADGCSLVPGYPLNFVADGKNAKTGIFPAFQLTASSTLYMQCYVNYCYSTSDLKCADYCAFNGGGRKKRQAETPESGEQRIVGQLKIRYRANGVTEIETNGDVQVEQSNNGDARVGQSNNQESSQEQCKNTISAAQQMGLIAGIVALAGLLLIVLIIAVVVFFRLSSRNEKVMKA